MIEKYEQKIDYYDEIEKANKTEFVSCDKVDAEYKHICGHDEVPPRPCRRVKI